MFFTVLVAYSLSVQTMVADIAVKQGVPEDLAVAVMMVESGGNRFARSPKGAVGLFQLMPATAAQYEVKDRTHAYDNAYAGIKHLKRLYGVFGDWRKAVAAYNAGMGPVIKYKGVPPYRETRNYVKKICAMAKC